MKRPLTFLLFSLGTVQPIWLSDFSHACSEAIRATKLLLPNFSGPDWCGPCSILKEQVFESEPFQAYAGDNLVPALAEPINPNRTFPFTVPLSVKGTVLKK